MRKKTILTESDMLLSLMTPREIRDMSVRLDIALLLISGCTFREIQKVTGRSPVSITRVNAMIKKIKAK